MSALQFHPLAVRAVRAVAEDAKLIEFEVPAALRTLFRFQAGQHLALRHGDQRRSYSICAAAGGALRVGVRRVPGGRFSTWIHEQVRPGDRLDVLPPQGGFGAALSTRPQHLLAVAGGSGITPLLSIVATALDADPRARCTLLYGNRSLASTMFTEELEDLKNRYMARLTLHPVFSREPVDSSLHGGHIDAGKLQVFLRLAGAVDQAFVCGPHAMNEDVERGLLDAGLARERVHVERFGVPDDTDPGHRAALHAPRAGDAGRARIRIVRDGVTREFGFRDGDASILAAAARAGIELPFSCRSGVCATCRARVLQGRVRMDRNFALETADLADGFVLCCQAHPLTESVELSLDAR